MDILGISGIPAIVVICYLIGMALKAWEAFDDRKIPVIMGVCGAVLGALAYYFNLAIPADDMITAVAVGIVSGFTATGVNQIWKQANKGDIE